MPASPKRRWKTNLILWIVPLAGLSTVLILLRAPQARGYAFGVESTLYPATKTSRMIATSTISATFGGAMIAAFATRRARGLFTGASTVLLASVLAMWVRSHLRTDHLDFIIAPESKSPKRAYFISDAGGFIAGFNRCDVFEPNAPTLLLGSDKSRGDYPVLEYYTPKTSRLLGRSGFAVLYKPDLDLTMQLETDGKFIAAPYWFPALLAAFLPALWLRRIARKQLRIRRGLCTNCGYDLRYSPNTCPECGHLKHARADDNGGDKQLTDE